MEKGEEALKGPRRTEYRAHEKELVPSARSNGSSVQECDALTLPISATQPPISSHPFSPLHRTTCRAPLLVIVNSFPTTVASIKVNTASSAGGLVAGGGTGVAVPASISAGEGEGGPCD